MGRYRDQIKGRAREQTGRKQFAFEAKGTREKGMVYTRREWIIHGEGYKEFYCHNQGTVDRTTGQKETTLLYRLLNKNLYILIKAAKRNAHSKN